MAKTKNKKSTAKKDITQKKKNKKKYKVRNWSKYNEMLVNRGRIDVWVEKGIWEQWFAEPGHKRKRGAKKRYSDKSIGVTLQFGQVFHQKLRQTEGLVTTIFNLMKIDLPVPDFSTLSRRGETITVDLP